MIPILIIILLMVIVLGGSFYLLRAAIYPHVRTVAETRQIEIDKKRINPSEYDAMEKEEFQVQSAYGYNLYGLYLPLPNSQRTVVISHGITCSHYGAVKYINLFRKRGCNVLLYDLRNHGHSGGKNTTFGFYERHDLRRMVDWAYQHLGENGKVGCMGESMGASITLMEAREDSRLAFVIADCPYSDLIDLFTFRMQDQYPWLPRWPFLPLASWLSQMMTGMRFEDVSPIKGIENLQTPALFVHGLEDHYIPPEMSQALYDNKTTGLVRLFLAPNAQHVESQPKNPEKYDEIVGDFLEEAGFFK